MAHTGSLPQLHPRLFMLTHSGHHNLSLIQALRQNQQSLKTYRSPKAINWELLATESNAVRQSEVISLQTLSLPLQAGIPAQLRSEPVSDLLPDQLYQLPEIHFELLDPKQETAAELVSSSSQFKTFAHGQPERQLLEYLSVILSHDLAEWGFSCQREANYLVFKAHPQLPGWNLKLKRLVQPAPHSAAPCSAGLKQGLSSIAAGQQSGKVATFHWGPWLINHKICQLSLPFEEPESFKQDFIAELCLQLKELELTAFWNPDGFLYLRGLRPGIHITISRLQAPEIHLPDQTLRLNLPEGHFASQSQELSLGSFRLNQAAIDLGPPPQEQNELRNWLCQTINRVSPQTQVQARLDSEDYLILQSLSSQSPLVIEDVSAGLEALLGLEPVRLGSLQNLEFDENQLRWNSLLNQLLQALPDDIPEAKALSELAQTIPSELGSYQAQQLNWKTPASEQDLTQLEAYLRQLLKALEACLAISSKATGQAIKPLALELELTKTGGQPSQPTSPPEPPQISSFDHKI